MSLRIPTRKILPSLVKCHKQFTGVLGACKEELCRSLLQWKEEMGERGAQVRAARNQVNYTRLTAPFAVGWDETLADGCRVLRDDARLR